MAGPFGDLTDVRLLAEVARHRSVSAAAGAVHISQPAASRRLHGIQTRVGLQLFQFGPRGAQLTEAGAFWATEATRILRGLDDAHSRFVTAFHLRSGLYFGASHVVADYLVPSWLSSWPRSRTVPANMVVGNTDEVVEMVTAAKVDFGVVLTASAEPAGLAGVRLFPDRLVLVTAPSHAWVRLGRAVTLAEVAQTPLIHRELTSGSQVTWMEAMTREGLAIAPPIMELDSLAAMKRAVAAGLGPAILPRIVVAEEIRVGQLREIVVAGLDLEVWVSVLWRESTDLSQVARQFIDHLRSVKASLQPV